jgi:hypothetical protein
MVFVGGEKLHKLYNSIGFTFSTFTKFFNKRIYNFLKVQTKHDSKPQTNNLLRREIIVFSNEIIHSRVIRNTTNSYYRYGSKNISFKMS